MKGDEAWLRDLAADYHSGAVEIVARVAERLQGDVQERIGEPERLADFGLRCISAQPSMAPLVNLFNDLLWALERSTADLSVHRAVLDEYTRQPVGDVQIGSGQLYFSAASLRTALAALMNACVQSGSNSPITCHNASARRSR